MYNTADTYIGYAADQQVRYKSSSGGIVTVVLKYLFDMGTIGTALTCCFDVEKCRYEPKFIYSQEQYELVGSVYQEMDIIRFVREHVDKIIGRILIICAPCQVQPIRHILRENNIESVILDYFCSGQTTLEGTYAYYKLIHIDKECVQGIRYRGNGWPNGIEISLKSGEIIRYPNYTEPWVSIQKSCLFRPQRCLKCSIVDSKDADISVGDPWLDEYKDETTGQSMFLVHSEYAKKIVCEMLRSGIILAKKVSADCFDRAQDALLAKADRSRKYPRTIAMLSRMSSNIGYCKFISGKRCTLSLHNKFVGKYASIERKLFKNGNRPKDEK